MALTKEALLSLEKKAHELRCLCIDTVSWAGSGHIGGSLSSIDILTLLYYHYMKINPRNPDWEDRDRMVVSKGHIGVGYAPVLADKGYFDKELLKEFNHTGSPLGIHLDSNKVPGVDASTGSLGHGLPLSLGMALAARYLKKDYKVFCLMGDGECNEGTVWEAAMAIAHYNAKNVIAYVDRNHCMMDGRTEQVMNLEPFKDKWQSFGFEVKEVNGHSFTELAEATDYALQGKKPTVIICNTIKGCGVDFIADDYRWHYGAFDEAKVEKAKQSLENYYQARVKGE